MRLGFLLSDQKKLMNEISHVQNYIPKDDVDSSLIDVERGKAEAVYASIIADYCGTIRCSVYVLK